MAKLPSMTGFGRGRGKLSDRLTASIVVRSVNSKYLDVQVRLSPREEIPEAEAAVREVVSEALQRGRVTAQVNLERTAPAAARVLVDTEALTALVAQLQSVELPGAPQGSVRLGEMLAIPGLVAISGEETALTDDEVAALRGVAREAVDFLTRMRREEGTRLGGQLRSELKQLEAFLDWFEPQMDELRERLHQRLRERMADVLGDAAGTDPERVVQEAALQADRADVAEEVVRLRSHVASFAARLESGGPVGRPLDFLCQEINRELNTLGSKCREVDVTERLVAAKTAVERVREQVQNLE